MGILTIDRYKINTESKPVQYIVSERDMRRLWRWTYGGGDFVDWLVNIVSNIVCISSMHDLLK